VVDFFLEYLIDDAVLGDRAEELEKLCSINDLLQYDLSINIRFLAIPKTEEVFFVDDEDVRVTESYHPS